MPRLLRSVIALVFMTINAVSAEAKRVAFVVGNADYNNISTLKNPQRDAATVGDRLKDLGFEVIELFNADAFSLNRAATSFLTKASGADLALFYFAGHGVQLFDRNFLLARDADPRSVNRPQDLGLDLSEFMGALRRSGAVRLALLIDACRDNPLSFEETVRILESLRTAPGFDPASTTASRGGRGLAPVDLRAGRQSAATNTAQTLLFFAAQPGDVSFDGSGLNSYYVEGLKEQLAKPDRGFTDILRAVSAYVRTVTGNQQMPQIVSDWTDDISIGASTPAARIEYHVHASGSKALTSADRKLVIRGASGYSKFQGDFIAKASISSEFNNLSEEEKRRVGQLGLGGGISLSISYDLDRDGRNETLHIRPRPQVGGYVLDVEVDGVRAEVSNCLVEAEHVEVALRDINGDRRPEVWIAYDRDKIPGWGRFCILEYKGLANLGELRRSKTGTVSAGYTAFRTLLRGESGWHMTVANDNTIKACGGSNCHTVWAYSFNGRQFRLLDDGSQKPAGAHALPFEDERERSAKLFANLANAAKPQTPTGWRVIQRSTNVITALARIGARTELSLECSYLPAFGRLESIVVRDLAGPASDAEVREEERLTYGEVLASSPMLIDGKACVLGGIGSDEKLGIRVSPVFGPEGGCWEKLYTATTITLPIVWKNTSLLELRMSGASPLLAAARRACMGDRTALTEPPVEHSTAPLTGSSEYMRARVARFITERYFRYGSGGAAETSQLLAASVDYYGKQRTRDEVVRDKLRYYAKWPERTYTLIPETLSVSVTPGLAGRWNTEFQYTFRVSNQGEVRSGRGVARLGLVPASSGGFLIAAESGEVLERQ